MYNLQVFQRINTLTGNRINVFSPTDAVHPADLITSTGRMIYINESFRVDAYVGWLQTFPNGSSADIRTLRLSADSVSPVKVVR
ncbi:hypothetical protein HDF25_002240 [Pedobacter cryoconitis]|uniref:Uncharacterized protein n=1 Tax=Pedobacter cryoconitis TaxID=188932 RepID=A0A7X0J5N9_9SPHI|nr:hypothetical protein [Pedobacter cryoconitis]